MKKRQSILFVACLLVLMMLACVIPTGGAATSIAPTVDPAQLDAMVAETVAAALEQTALAPTPTQQVIATEPPTVEPTVSATSVPQSSITHQADGNALYVDEKAGFNMLVPPGWLPVRIDQLEYYDAFSLPQAADANLQTALMQINTLDPKIYRLFIFDLQEGHLANGFVNNINVVLSPDSMSLKTDEEIQKTADSLPAAVPGLVVQSSTVSTTASGNQVGVILSEIGSQKEDGSELVLFQKQVFLNVKGGLLVITFTSEQSSQEENLPVFDTMIESIQLGE